MKLKGYNVHVCHTCYQEAAAGWPVHHEAALFSALDQAGLLIPDRNDRGLLPRDYEPPADFNL